MTTMSTAVHVSATGHPEYTETLPREPESAGRARTLVAQALSAWNLDDLADTGRLVVSELVANTVEHTGCRHLRVTLTRLGPDRVRIGVVDKSAKNPVQRITQADEEHGRGLMVVAALSEKTGTDTFTWGKRVWAECVLEANPAAHQTPAPQ